MDYWRDWVWKKHDDPPEDGFCWACGMIPTRGLERAHIQARCNGGPDTVENLHLLCCYCHKASEYREGDDYWNWIETWTFVDVVMGWGLKNGYPIASTLMGMSREPS